MNRKNLYNWGPLVVVVAIGLALITAPPLGWALVTFTLAGASLCGRQER